MSRQLERAGEWTALTVTAVLLLSWIYTAFLKHQSLVDHVQPSTEQSTRYRHPPPGTVRPVYWFKLFGV